MEDSADGDDLAADFGVILQEPTTLVQAPEPSLEPSDGALHVLPELLKLAVEGPLLVRSRIAELRDQDGLQWVARICNQSRISQTMTHDLLHV